MAFHGIHYYARYSGGLTVSEDSQISHLAFLAYLRHTSGPLWCQFGSKVVTFQTFCAANRGESKTPPNCAP